MKNLKEFLENELAIAREYAQDCADRGESISLQAFQASGEINAYEKILGFLQEN